MADLYIRHYGQRDRVQTTNTGETKTKESFQDACDINQIMKKFENGDIISHTSSSPPFYGDFSGAEDYHTTQNRIADANAGFMTLPAKIRDQFDNDAGKLLDFMSNPDNREECEKLGILDPLPPGPKDPNPPPQEPENQQESAEPDSSSSTPP